VSGEIAERRDESEASENNDQIGRRLGGIDRGRVSDETENNKENS
jgi:hypothetical protein